MPLLSKLFFLKGNRNTLVLKITFCWCIPHTSEKWKCTYTEKLIWFQNTYSFLKHQAIWRICKTSSSLLDLYRSWLLWTLWSVLLWACPWSYADTIHPWFSLLFFHPLIFHSHLLKLISLDSFHPLVAARDFILWHDVIYFIDELNWFNWWIQLLHWILIVINY